MAKKLLLFLLFLLFYPTIHFFLITTFDGLTLFYKITSLIVIFSIVIFIYLYNMKLFYHYNNTDSDELIILYNVINILILLCVIIVLTDDANKDCGCKDTYLLWTLIIKILFVVQILFIFPLFNTNKTISKYKGNYKFVLLLFVFFVIGLSFIEINFYYNAFILILFLYLLITITKVNTISMVLFIIFYMLTYGLVKGEVVETNILYYIIYTLIGSFLLHFKKQSQHV